MEQATVYRQTDGRVLYLAFAETPDGMDVVEAEIDTGLLLLRGDVPPADDVGNYTVVDGVITHSPVFDVQHEDTVQDIKANLAALVEEAYNRIIRTYIPPEKAASYQAKAALADIWFAEPVPDADDPRFEMIKNEAAGTGETVADLMQMIADNAAAWPPISGTLDGIRRKAQSDILASETEADARAVYQALDWQGLDTPQG